MINLKTKLSGGYIQEGEQDLVTFDLIFQAFINRL